MADFLLEIGTEEIPDWMIEPALQSLRSDFLFAAGELQARVEWIDATPRRLVLVARGLDEKRADRTESVSGPSVGAGSKAAEGFARKFGMSVDQLEQRNDKYFAVRVIPGRTAVDLLAERLPVMIAKIYFPKTMTWTGKNGVRFIRPIRWIVALIDDGIVPFEVAGVKAGNTTRGHRILGSREPLPVTVATYEKVLRDNGVIVHAHERKQRIEAGLGPGVHKDDDLLRTLIYLTEFPTPIHGSFDPSYLELPQEILSTVMRHHQRYFSVVKEDGSLAPKFVAVTNTAGDPDGLIRQGNERVLRARFNDARFFWNVDQQKKLRQRVNDLEKVTFHAKLGSYYEKTGRIVRLAETLANQVGANMDATRLAAELCKTDLTTEMVKEFTELQGVVGGLYAKAQGESEAVATAIYDHYKPTSMEDSIPRTPEGQIVSIADKLDTLRACFEIDLVPTGSKDPFGLRRAAQGIVKILFEARLPIALFSFVPDERLRAFLRERIEFYLRDVLGYAYDEVNAVLVPAATTLADLADRVEAIHYIRPTENFEPLAASFKRIKNILKQAQVTEANRPDRALLKAGPELDLYEASGRVREAIQTTASYREKLALIASLRPKVDLFFDKILVNDPDPAIRQNRLALLHGLLTEFSTIADFSEIVTQGATGV